MTSKILVCDPIEPWKDDKSHVYAIDVFMGERDELFAFSASVAAWGWNEAANEARRRGCRLEHRPRSGNRREVSIDSVLRDYGTTVIGSSKSE